MGLTLAVWLSIMVSFGIIVWIFNRKKILILIPSVMFFTFFFVRIQLPSAFELDRILEIVKDPTPFFILVYFAPILLVTLSVSIWSWRGSELQTKLTKGREDLGSVGYLRFPGEGAIWVLLMLLFGIYLVVVPLSQTGLYTFISDPVGVALAREKSIKLVDSVFAVYAYTFIQGAVVPVLLGLIVLKFYFNSSTLQSKLMIFALPAIFLFLLIMIPATRAGLSYMVILIFVISYLARNLSMDSVTVAILASIIFILPLLYILRSNEASLSLEDIQFYWEYGIYERFFVTPGLVAGWWINDAQYYGFTGISGIPKIAWLFGITSVDMSNVVGLEYATHSLDSISAGTNQLFAYYNYFGYFGLLLSVLGYLLIDLIALSAYRFVRPELIFVTGGIVSVVMVHSIETEVIPLLVTHGLIPSMLILLFLSKRLRR